MIGFTPLETRVLDLIGLSSGQLVEPLRALVQRAQVIKRDNTGHGFYTRMSIEEPVKPLIWPERLITGPDISVRVDRYTLWRGTILWLNDGIPACLEAYQYCTPTGGDIDLKEHDLHALGLIGLHEEYQSS